MYYLIFYTQGRTCTMINKHPPFFCDETCVYIYHKIYFLSMYCFAYRWIQQEEIKERERDGEKRGSAMFLIFMYNNL